MKSEPRTVRVLLSPKATELASTEVTMGWGLWTRRYRVIRSFPGLLKATGKSPALEGKSRGPTVNASSSTLKE
jgi:hypothetical protein